MPNLRNPSEIDSDPGEDEHGGGLVTTFQETKEQPPVPNEPDPCAPGKERAERREQLRIALMRSEGERFWSLARRAATKPFAVFHQADRGQRSGNNNAVTIDAVEVIAE